MVCRDNHAVVDLEVRCELARAWQAVAGGERPRVQAELDAPSE